MDDNDALPQTPLGDVNRVLAQAALANSGVVLLDQQTATAPPPPSNQAITVDLFPKPVPNPLTPDTKFQTALATAIASAETRMKLDPGSMPVAFTLVDISPYRARPSSGVGGRGDSFPSAGYRQDETDYIGSEAKVPVMYAAYALLDTVRRVAASFASDSPAAFFTALSAQLSPRIASAVPRIASATDIKNELRVPRYKEVFTATKAAGELTVDFSKAYDMALEKMIVESDNAAAGKSVKGLGYGYLNGSLSDGGFFEDSTTPQGLWTAGDFQSGQKFKAVRINSMNDGLVAQAGTTRQMARLISLITTNQVLGLTACREMLGRLARAVTGPSRLYIADAGVLRPGCVTHTKIGYGPLKNGGVVHSEVSVLTDPIAQDRTYVVAWQNFASRTSLNDKDFAPIATIIRDTIAEFEKP